MTRAVPHENSADTPKATRPLPPAPRYIGVEHTLMGRPVLTVFVDKKDAIQWWLKDRGALSQRRLYPVNLFGYGPAVEPGLVPAEERS